MNSLENLGSLLRRNWWLMLLRGLAAIGFGILVIAKPQISLQVLVYMFGIYVLVEGILGVAVAIQGRNEIDSWGVLLLWGLLGVAVGILAFLKPDLTALALLFYIAAWAIATGVLQILAAIRLRKIIKNEWWLVLGGLASVVFGALLMASPGAGALVVLWLIAAYAVLFGVVLVILAFRVRSFGQRLAH